MPLVKVDKNPEQPKVLIWHITEEEEFFSSKLTPILPIQPWQDFKPKRRLEWLATRYLLQLGLPQTLSVAQLRKDEYGCPYLSESNLRCGISHTHNYVAVVIDYQKVACDIETYQFHRIENIAPKIIGEPELEWLQNQYRPEQLHLIWGIKESAYKTWGKRNIHWLRDIHIEPIHWNPKKGSFTGRIGSQGAPKLSFYGEYEYHEHFLIVWTKEIKS